MARASVAMSGTLPRTQWRQWQQSKPPCRLATLHRLLWWSQSSLVSSILFTASATSLVPLGALAPLARSRLLTPGDALKAAVSANPKTKADFTELSANIVAALAKKHEANPLFPAFVEQLAKDLCESLSAVQTRKVSSALSVLGNTKQQEERDKASGKKKVGPAASARSAEAAAKWLRSLGKE